MNKIFVKTAVIFWGALMLGMFTTCDPMHFFDTVVVSHPGTNQPVTNDPPEVQAIKMRFQQLTPKPANPADPNEIYSTPPDWTTLASPVAGVLKDTYENNGLDALNFARYLAGLDPVSLDAGLKLEAETGAELLAIIDGGLTHHPDIAAANVVVAPAVFDQAFFDLGSAGAADSNLFLGTSDAWVLSDSVAEYANDTYPAAINRLERRRQMLNPAMGKTAFGRAFTGGSSGISYMTMQTADTSNTGGASPAYVAWPSPANGGYFPAEFFGANQAWSVSLSASAYDTTVAAAAITVTLTNVTDSGAPEVITSADTDVNGKYFNVDTNPLGVPYCIIFRQGGTIPLAGKKYSVEITGLLDTGGAPADIQYEVEFFRLSP